jgi:hypothetical protein
MEPLLILVPGLFGGLVLALVIAGTRRGSPRTVVPGHLEAPSPALINMAHIRVEGVGGLGLVAAVVAVALTDPRIRLAILAAAVLGAVLAVSMIATRRHTGALPSNGDGPDDRSVLRLQDAGPRRDPANPRASVDRLERGGRGRGRRFGQLPSRALSRTIPA